MVYCVGYVMQVCCFSVERIPFGRVLLELHGEIVACAYVFFAIGSIVNIDKNKKIIIEHSVSAQG